MVLGIEKDATFFRFIVFDYLELIHTWKGFEIPAGNQVYVFNDNVMSLFAHQLLAIPITSRQTFIQPLARLARKIKASIDINSRSTIKQLQVFFGCWSACVSFIIETTFFACYNSLTSHLRNPWIIALDLLISGVSLYAFIFHFIIYT